MRSRRDRVLSGLAAGARRLRLAFTRNTPQKLGALGLAALLWAFVSTNGADSTLRTLPVPLMVEGVEEGDVAVGVPREIQVSVRGPATRIDRLRPDLIEATLDLTDVVGEFRREVEVLTPQGVALVDREPAEVIGTVEAVTLAEFAVSVAFSGSPGPDVRLEATLEPETVAARGLAGPIGMVARVVALAPAEAGVHEAPLVALDAERRPVEGVETLPPTATVRVEAEPAFARATVPISVVPPAAPGFAVTARLSAPEVVVTGPPSLLEGLEEVRAEVDPPTAEPEPGSYTLPVRLALPDGVVAAETPTVTVRLARPTPPR